MTQLSLLDAVVDCYLDSENPIGNEALYHQVAAAMKVPTVEASRKVPVGGSGKKHNLFHRQVRWCQQTLKRQGLLTRISQAHWELHKHKRSKLRAIRASKQVLAVSTDLGICIWTRSRSIFKDMINEDVHLVLSSPPYPIRKPRAYGGVLASDYTDFICAALEPIIPKLARGANIALNLSNDIFEPGLPARSTYLERLVIALEDRLGLKLMERHPWVSNKPPGPVKWASMERIHLNVAWEPVYWFCNDPLHTLADNRRVLRPHTLRHAEFVKSGGSKQTRSHGDGAHVQHVGSYSGQTAGSIPRNVLQFGNSCPSGRQVNAYARDNGLPTHGAKMPLSMPDFLIRWLSRPGDLVVDPFAGTMTTGEAAQMNGRRWLCLEMMLDYIQQGFVRFSRFQNAWFNPELMAVPKP